MAPVSDITNLELARKVELSIHMLSVRALFELSKITVVVVLAKV